MNNEKAKRIDEILQSLDGMQRAEAPAFFYSRLRERMEKELVRAKPKPWLLRPAFALIALLIVLLVNIAVVFQNDGQTKAETTANTDTESLQTLASEYSITDAGSIYDLNLER